MTTRQGHGIIGKAPQGWRTCSKTLTGEHGEFTLIIDRLGRIAAYHGGEDIRKAPADFRAFIDVGAEIRLARIDHNMTQKRLAELVGVYVGNGMVVSAWENGWRKPAPKYRPLIDSQLGTTLQRTMR